MIDSVNSDGPMPRRRLLLTVEEAAQALAISRTTLYVLLRAGELASVHIGRSVRIPVSALETFVDSLMPSMDATP